MNNNQMSRTIARSKEQRETCRKFQLFNWDSNFLTVIFEICSLKSKAKGLGQSYGTLITFPGIRRNILKIWEKLVRTFEWKIFSTKLTWHQRFICKNTDRKEIKLESCGMAH